MIDKYNYTANLFRGPLSMVLAAMLLAFFTARPVWGKRSFFSFYAGIGLSLNSYSGDAETLETLLEDIDEGEDESENEDEGEDSALSSILAPFALPYDITRDIFNLLPGFSLWGGMRLGSYFGLEASLSSYNVYRETYETSAGTTTQSVSFSGTNTSALVFLPLGNILGAGNIIDLDIYGKLGQTRLSTSVKERASASGEGVDGKEGTFPQYGLGIMVGKSGSGYLRFEYSVIPGIDFIGSSEETLSIFTVGALLSF